MWKILPITAIVTLVPATVSAALGLTTANIDVLLIHTSLAVLSVAADNIADIKYLEIGEEATI